VFSIIGAVVEAALEQLDCDDGEDELEQHVDDHDVEHVLQRVDHAVEHRLTGWVKKVSCCTVIAIDISKARQ